MTEAQMYEKALQRPTNHREMSPKEQWATDKRLGILDWDGGCQHTTPMCKACKKRYDNRGK